MSTGATDLESQKPRPAGRRVRLSIAWALGGAYGILLVVALVIVLALTATSNYRNTVGLLNDKAILLMRTLTDRIRLDLEPAADAVREFGILYSNGAFDLDDAVARDTIIVGMLTSADILDAVVVYDLDMHRTGLYRAADGDFRELTAVADLPMPDQQRLQQLQAGDPPTWGPLVMVGDDAYVNVAAPLVREGKLRGYVAAAVSAGVLSDLVARVGREDGATTFVLYGDHALFAHARGEELQLKAKRAGTRAAVPLDEAGDEILAEYDKRRVLTPFERAGAEGVEVSEVDQPDGQGVVMMTERIDRFGPVPWIAGLYIPREALIDEIERLFGTIVVGLITLLIAVAVSIAISRRMARPLTRLATEAGRIERFELEAVEALPSSPVRELDSTSTAFNGMVTALRAFSAYVPRALVRRMLEIGYDEATRLESREATVLFTDIVGFTALSETMQTREVAQLLNDHFATLVGCVEAEGGIVDKFIGDGMLAVWSASDPASNAAHAIAAALAIADGANAMLQDPARRCGTPLRLRIGIHSGSVLAGNLGAAGRVNYTVIGDTVNVASRLEALGKAVDPEAAVVVLTSDHTVGLARQTIFPFEAEAVGAWALRGRAGRVEVQRIRIPEKTTSVAESSAESLRPEAVTDPIRA